MLFPTFAYKKIIVKPRAIPKIVFFWFLLIFVSENFPLYYGGKKLL